MEKISVIIVEDHATTRVGLRVELSQEPDIVVVDVAGTVDEAIRKCVVLRPDVILLDLHLPDSAGPKSLVSTFVPLGRVLVFSGEGTKNVIRRVLDLGAAGFVSKSDSTAQLISKIRNIMSSESARTIPPAEAGPAAIQELTPEFEDPIIGKIIDERYRISEVLGFGSYSVVYKGADLQSNRPVAVKILHAHLALIKESAGRFHREAEACSRLKHPNIATVYAHGITDYGQPYLAMEYVTGTSLGAELDRLRKLPAERVVGIARQICAGLNAAHGQGIVHRDIKPANIHLAHDNVVKILDFGLVKVISGEESALNSLTAEGSTIGTPCYMSPEQCQGEAIDGRSDIYSLGCLMFELLSGRRLFDGATVVDVLLNHINTKPDFQPLVDANVPKSIITIIDRAVQKDPKARFRSAREMGYQLGLTAETTENKRMSIFDKWTSS